ncbi:MAG: DUF4124 domain-containing protein [Oceanicoccus sp.]
MPKYILIFILTGLVNLSASAEIYSWKNNAGNTVYSDQHRSGQAITETSTNSSDYYSAKPDRKTTDSVAETTELTAKTSRLKQQHLATLSAVANQDSVVQAMTESECQQLYGISCDRVVNWKEYATDACDDDSRCLDDDFLDKKYRPRTILEMQKIAQRAAIRNNLQDDKIALFLTKKYSNYCANQALMYCQNKRDTQCAATMRSYCDDNRNLKDIFQNYDNLSALEKQKIVNRAKSLAMSSGANQLDYEQIVASLIELLISQALLGL